MGRGLNVVHVIHWLIINKFSWSICIFVRQYQQGILNSISLPGTEIEQGMLIDISKSHQSGVKLMCKYFEKRGRQQTKSWSSRLIINGGIALSIQPALTVTVVYRNSCQQYFHSYGESCHKFGRLSDSVNPKPHIEI